FPGLDFNQQVIQYTRHTDGGVESKKHLTNQIPQCINWLTSDSNFTYAYDNNGNLISKTNINTNETTEYHYDYENRLIGISYPGGSTNTFEYSALGIRLSKTNSNGTVRYLYDGDNILMEFGGSGQLISRYTTSLMIDEIISRQDAGGEVYYYHYDGLGSVTCLTDALQEVAATYRYDAFGEV
ncbi:MAG: hypothetical protein AB1797_14050, partial [bacterium]